MQGYTTGRRFSRRKQQQAEVEVGAITNIAGAMETSDARLHLAAAVLATRADDHKGRISQALKVLAVMNVLTYSAERYFQSLVKAACSERQVAVISYPVVAQLALTDPAAAQILAELTNASLLPEDQRRRIELTVLRGLRQMTVAAAALPTRIWMRHFRTRRHHMQDTALARATIRRAAVRMLTSRPRRPSPHLLQGPLMPHAPGSSARTSTVRAMTGPRVAPI